MQVNRGHMCQHVGHRDVVFGLFVYWCKWTEVTCGRTEVTAAWSLDCWSVVAGVWNCVAAVASCGVDPVPSRSTRVVWQSQSCYGHYLTTRRRPDETYTRSNRMTDTSDAVMQCMLCALNGLNQWQWSHGVKGSADPLMLEVGVKAIFLNPQ